MLGNAAATVPQSVQTTIMAETTGLIDKANYPQIDKNVLQVLTWRSNVQYFGALKGIGSMAVAIVAAKGNCQSSTSTLPFLAYVLGSVALLSASVTFFCCDCALADDYHKAEPDSTTANYYRKNLYTGAFFRLVTVATAVTGIWITATACS